LVEDVYSVLYTRQRFILAQMHTGVNCVTLNCSTMPQISINIP